jgi:hypothetical protein
LSTESLNVSSPFYGPGFVAVHIGPSMVGVGWPWAPGAVTKILSVLSLR